MSKALRAGGAEVERILSRESEAERMAAYDPVAAARMKSAETLRESADLALQEAMSKARADEALKGYAGTGSFARGQLLKAATPFRQAGAQAVAGAEMENALQRYQIPLQEQALRLSTIPMAEQVGRSGVMLEQMPTTAAVQQQQEALRGISPFMLNPESFRYSPLPSTSTASPMGAGLTAASAAAGSAGRGLANYQVAREFGYGNGGTAGSFGAYNPGMTTSENVWLNQARRDLNRMPSV
jgi:hypothetical protein